MNIFQQGRKLLKRWLDTAASSVNRECATKDVIT